MIDIINTNLQHYALQPNVYILLKAIVDKSITNPKIYDLMDNHIQEKLINSWDTSVRKMSAKIFEKFLLHYPLTEKWVEQHFFFILRNIEFEEDEGRMTVINLLLNLIKKFP